METIRCGVTSDTGIKRISIVRLSGNEILSKWIVLGERIRNKLRIFDTSDLESDPNFASKINFSILDNFRSWTRGVPKNQKSAKKTSEMNVSELDLIFTKKN